MNEWAELHDEGKLQDRVFRGMNWWNSALEEQKIPFHEMQS